MRFDRAPTTIKLATEMARPPLVESGLEDLLVALMQRIANNMGPTWLERRLRPHWDTFLSKSAKPLHQGGAPAATHRALRDVR